MKFLSAVLSVTLLSLAAAILPDKCSVDHCGTNGALAPCTQTHPFKVTTCGTWSRTREAIIQCKRLDCTGQSCYFIPLLASDGNLYCTPCHIHQVGCRTGFKVYGPVNGQVARQASQEAEHVEDIETPISREVEEVAEVEEDPVSRAAIPILPICSMKFCTKNGARARCFLPLPQGGSASLTCLKFSFLPQSQEQCRFFCPLLCLPEDQQPVANTGEKFCNECLLRQESCRTRYKTFGPVTMPTKPPTTTLVPTPFPVEPTCTMPFCTMSGRSAGCVLNRKRANCAAFAETEEKKKACDFACIQICVDPEEAPVDNFGKKYCSVCHLRQASCQSDFKIFLVKN